MNRSVVVTFHHNRYEYLLFRSLNVSFTGKFHKKEFYFILPFNLYFYDWSIWRLSWNCARLRFLNLCLVWIRISRLSFIKSATPSILEIPLMSCNGNIVVPSVFVIHLFNCTDTRLFWSVFCRPKPGVQYQSVVS